MKVHGAERQVGQAMSYCFCNLYDVPLCKVRRFVRIDWGIDHEVGAFQKGCRGSELHDSTVESLIPSSCPSVISVISSAVSVFHPIKIVMFPSQKVGNIHASPSYICSHHRVTHIFHLRHYCITIILIPVSSICLVTGPSIVFYFNQRLICLNKHPAHGQKCTF